jgi:hypothetical protein
VRPTKVIEWTPGHWWVVEGKAPDAAPPYIPLHEGHGEGSTDAERARQRKLDCVRWEYTEQRNDYVHNYKGDDAGAQAHHAFYLWLADRLGVTLRHVPASLEELRASTDPHFNDIPLARWDRMDPIIRGHAISYGLRGWSLCETVCVLKAVARAAVKTDS